MNDKHTSTHFVFADSFLKQSQKVKVFISYNNSLLIHVLQGKHHSFSEEKNVEHP